MAKNNKIAVKEFLLLSEPVARLTGDEFSKMQLFFKTTAHNNSSRMRKFSYEKFYCLKTNRLDF